MTFANWIPDARHSGFASPSASCAPECLQRGFREWCRRVQTPAATQGFLPGPPTSYVSFQGLSPYDTSLEILSATSPAHDWHSAEQLEMASIRKRIDKWHVQVRRTGHPSKTRSFTHKADAEAWGRKTEREFDRREIGTDHRSLKLTTVGMLLERYLVEITPTKRGADAERYHLKALQRDPISKQVLVACTSGSVASFRDRRLKKVRPATVRRELVILRHCFEVATRDWDYPNLSNPVAKIEMPSNGPARERRLEEDELSALLAACRKSRVTYLKPAIGLALETGMRRGELLSIKWEDIDLTAALLTIPHTKNGHQRTIPLTSEAVKILSSLPAVDDRVFQATPNAFRLAWSRLKRRADLQNLRFHDLRHEAISRFFELGLSVPEVALISGHRDPRMLFRYTHLKPELVVRKLRAGSDPAIDQHAH